MRALSFPKLVGLFVDAGEKELSEAAPLLTHFQFHGHESPERCEELGVAFAMEVIKAITGHRRRRSRGGGRL